MDAVTALEASVDLSRHELRLRGVKGFWKQLQAARAKAVTDPKALVAYKALLTQGVMRACRDEAEQTPLEGEELEQACANIWAYYEQCRQEGKVSEHEANRVPGDMGAWMEKWRPDPYRRYSRALDAWLNTATPANLAALKQAMHQLVQAYVV